MVTRQRVGAAVVAAVGAIGVTASAYLSWFDDDDATQIPLERLFQTDATGEPTSYWNSMAMPLAVVALLGIVGALLLSRFVLSLGWLIGVAALVLWAVMSSADDAVSFSFGDIQAGAWVCAAALLVMLAGIAALRGRERDTVAPEPVEPPGLP
ncbi:hypothetical protein [Jiangella asiatica]|uniref:Uncharacterized protein n=1 Tax=Jiangella asiatica TaxID=2530372 RepID=A0A4R5CIV4_9ACTN|nr:hypothetical protein [Jiangella asiatica]TDD98253.1 hypothetical protein E1269_28850 [Jiangella asiatica]